MDFSVIIPIYNTPNLLNLLEHIMISDIWDYNYEILIIDDGSDISYTNSYEKAIWKCSYVSLYRIGDKKRRFRVAQAKNLWATMSQYNTLIFLDQEVFLHKNYFHNIKKYFKKWVVGGRMHGFNDMKKSLNIQILKKFYLFADIKNTNFHDIRDEWLDVFRHPWTQAFGTNMICDRHSFQEIWWFDELFIGWWIEDNDFCYRAQQKWISVKYEKNISLINLWESLYNGIGIISSEEKIFSGTKNLKYFLQKHSSDEAKDFVLHTLKSFEYILKDRKKRKIF